MREPPQRECASFESVRVGRAAGVRIALGRGQDRDRFAAMTDAA
jgi:hypothetical protein